MRSKWLLSVVGLALVAAGAYLALRPGVRRDEAPAPAPAAGRGAVVSAAAPAAPAAPSVAVAAFRAAKPVERIEAFYREESRRVGAVDPDPAGTEQRLKAVAEELNPQEVSWLQQASLDRKREGDGRFFATFLLALNAQGPALGALREIALNPVPASKNQGVVELERQIRALASEGLGRARGVREAQDALLDVVEKQEDEFLRDRAHRALYAWETGKSVEEQDREALGKVLYGKEKKK